MRKRLKVGVGGAWDRPSNLCFSKQYMAPVNEVLDKIPLKIKKRFPYFLYSITDLFDMSLNPYTKINGEILGKVFTNDRRIVYLTRKADIFSEDAIKGLVIHEIAHAYIGKFSKWYLKLYFWFKFKNIQNILKPLCSEELYADWLAKKWGFEKEILALNKERTIF